MKLTREATAPALITHAYTRHLPTVAQLAASIQDIIVAAVLLMSARLRGNRDCARVQRCRAAVPTRITPERIRTHSSQEFIAGAERLGCLLDDLNRGMARAQSWRPWETLFLTSSRYEYLFWEMAWTQSSWPV